MIRNWSQKADRTLTEACEAIKEDMQTGASFAWSVEHYADLYEIDEATLRHEWNLRTGDNR